MGALIVAPQYNFIDMPRMYLRKPNLPALALEPRLGRRTIHKYVS